MTAPSGYVPAGPVKRHLLKLTHLRWSAVEIARAAGVGHVTVSMILAGNRNKVQARIAEKILAVPVVAAAGQGTTSFRLELPWPRPLLNANRMPADPRARGRIVRQIQTDVMFLARNQKLPNGKHLTIGLHYAPGNWTRIDGNNLQPTVKAAVDALARPTRKLDPKNPRSRPWIGLSLVPDDDDRYVTVLEPRIVRPDESDGPKCWLTIEIER